jgi:hypothetical protein
LLLHVTVKQKNYYVHLCPKTPGVSRLHVKRKLGGGSLLPAHEDVPGKLQDQHLIHTSNAREYDYVNLAVRRDYSSPATRTLRQPCRAPRLLHLRRASGCLGTSRGSSRGSRRSLSTTPGSSRGSSRRSSSTTPGSSSTTSPSPRVRVPRHVARLVTRLVAPLVVDYFTSAARPGASARRVTRFYKENRIHLTCAPGSFYTHMIDKTSVIPLQ